MNVDWPGRVSLLAAIGGLACLFFVLSFGLAFFPGLHGDEAWAGLRAISIVGGGPHSIHGMNAYTGGLFPHIVAAAFAQADASVTSLRMPGVVLNVMAVGILLFAFRAYRHAALHIVLLFAASLLFLFYSRIAWEVTALQNLLVAIILACTVRLLPAPRLLAGTAALFFGVFILGTLNHFIFSAAALSLSIASLLIVSRSINAQTSRLFFIAMLNLLLQVIVMAVKFIIPDGPFATHVLPAIVGTGLLVGAATFALVHFESAALAAIEKFQARRPRFVERFHRYLFRGLLGCFLLILPFNGTSFWGIVSGALAMERIVSHVPGLLEGALLYSRMAVLVLAFSWLAWRRSRSQSSDNLLKELLLIWPLIFLVTMQMETIGLSDRYFIIPQMIFFVGLAISMPDLPLLARRVVQAVMIIGVIQTQFFFWAAVTRKDDAPPLQRFRYAFYFDSSRHFLKTDALVTHLKQSGICAVTSSSYFIIQPMKFLLASPSCPASHTAQVEYCDSCQTPVPWFRIAPSQDAVKPGQ